MVVTGAGIPNGTTISAVPGGSVGNIGTYTLSQACNIGGGIFVGGTDGSLSTTLNIRTVTTGNLTVGTSLLGTTIASFGTGSGGVGTYTLASAVNVPSAVFIGSTGAGSSNTTLTVASINFGTITLGMLLSGTNVPTGTVISAFGTGTGGAGTYTLSIPCTVSAGTTITGGTIINAGVITGTITSSNPSLVIAGGGTGTPNCFAYSNDGQTWTAGEGTTVFVTGRSVVYNAANNIWWSSGTGSGGTGNNTTAYSNDGITWYGASAYNNITDCNVIFWDGNQYISGGSGSSTLAYSTDALNWYASGNSTICYSTDKGNTWLGVPCSILLLSGGLGIASNGNLNRWIAVGTGNVFSYSDNGITWGNFNQLWAGGIKWIPVINKFVAAAYSSRTTLKLITYSSDGVNWFLTNTGGNNGCYFDGGRCIAFKPGSAGPPTVAPIILAVGTASGVSNNNASTFVYRSTDGINWTSTILPFNTWSIVYAEGLSKFFVFGKKDTNLSARILSSSDGITWTSTTVPKFNGTNNVKAAWSPFLSKLCALGDSSSIVNDAVMTSTDGTSWTTFGNLPAANFTCIEWSPSLKIFCALLYSTTNTNQQCIISADGVNWYNANTLTTNNLFRELVWSSTLGVFCGVGRPGSTAPAIYVSKLIV